MIPRLAVLLHDAARDLEESLDPLMEADLAVGSTPCHSYLLGGGVFTAEDGAVLREASVAEQQGQSQRAEDDRTSPGRVLRIPDLLDPGNRVPAQRLRPCHLELAAVREAYLALIREVVQLLNELAVAVEGPAYRLKMSTILHSTGYIRQLGAATRRLQLYAEVKEPALALVSEFLAWLQAECDEEDFGQGRASDIPPPAVHVEAAP